MHDVGADTISLTGHIIGNFMFLFIKLYISKSDDFRFLPQGAGYDKHWIVEELLRAVFMVV